ncbi:MAG: SDR family oxidoreductase [Deltaproteobacteria bacterium]|nr:SDR family oxidoreductase [Deltaproteobacteria bacterium]
MSTRGRTKEVVVITGAAAGIGHEIASLYLASGATVVALDMDREGLKTLNCPGIEVNVVDGAQLLDVAQRITREHGKPTVWINNAGIQSLGAFEEVAPEAFRRVMCVNFDGVVNGTRAAISVMKEPVRGTIVNMASVAGIVPAPFMTAYTASKHAVVGFTRGLRQELELAHSPIKIILVAPGFVKTKIMAPGGGFSFPDWLRFMVSEPDTVAREILDGISKGQVEIHPTASGKMFIKLYRVMPDLISRSSRLLVAKNWKELLGFTRIGKK